MSVLRIVWPKCTLAASHKPLLSYDEYADETDKDRRTDVVDMSLSTCFRLILSVSKFICFSLCRFALFLLPLFHAPSIGAMGSCPSRLPLDPPLARRKGELPGQSPPLRRRGGGTGHGNCKFYEIYV